MSTDDQINQLLDRVVHNDINGVERMLEAGADIDYVTKKVYSPLMVAVLQGFPKMTKFLLEKGADMDLVGPEYETAMDMTGAGVTDYELQNISQADYIEGLQKAYDGMLENLEALQELDKQMMHYYGDTLDMVTEEIDKYTSVLEHQTQMFQQKCITIYKKDIKK